MRRLDATIALQETSAENSTETTPVVLVVVVVVEDGRKSTSGLGASRTNGGRHSVRQTTNRCVRRETKSNERSCSVRRILPTSPIAF